jgi:hypothetical protein
MPVARPLVPSRVAPGPARGDVPAAGRPARTGRSRLERAAIARVTTDVAALPASLVVQLVLWPTTIAEWAREHEVATAVAYNMLARFKPYARVRELLATSMGVPLGAVTHLVDLPPAAAARRPPSGLPRAELAPVDAAVAGRIAARPHRTGSSPLERLAVARVAEDVAALPASLVVQLLLWPQSIADWTRERRVAPSLVYTLLANGQPAPRIERALALRLGVGADELRELIEGERAPPAAWDVAALLRHATATQVATRPGAGDGRNRTHRRTRDPGPASQLSLLPAPEPNGR